MARWAGAVERRGRRLRGGRRPVAGANAAGALVYSAEGGRLHVVVDKVIETIDVSSGARLARFGAELDEVAISADGRYALGVRTKAQTIESFDLRTGRSGATYRLMA